MALRELSQISSIGIHDDDLRHSFHPHHESDLFAIRGPRGSHVKTRRRGKSLEVPALEVDEIKIRVSFQIRSEGNPLAIGRPDG
jgi:hypothetical protein